MVGPTSIRAGRLHDPPELAISTRACSSSDLICDTVRQIRCRRFDPVIFLYWHLTAGLARSALFFFSVTTAGSFTSSPCFVSAMALLDARSVVTSTVSTRTLIMRIPPMSALPRSVQERHAEKKPRSTGWLTVNDCFLIRCPSDVVWFNA